MVRGTKTHPRCQHCGKDGHYATTCPTLAQKVLKSLASHSLKSLQEHVAAGKQLRLASEETKKKRTLKRASGRRTWNQTSKVGPSKKKRQESSKTKHAASDSMRRTRPMKAIQNQPHFNAKKTYAAYNTLVSSGWIQKVKTCSCGEQFTRVPWATGQQRGRGRLWLRCYACGSASECFFETFLFVSYTPWCEEAKQSFTVRIVLHVNRQLLTIRCITCITCITCSSR